MKITIKQAPRVGTGYYVRYDRPEREDNGQGAIVGYDEVLHYLPTRKAARAYARGVLANPDVTSATILQPIEYHRREPDATRDKVARELNAIADAVLTMEPERDCPVCGNKPANCGH